MGYKNGAVDPGYVQTATVTLWTSNMLILTVPSGALTGLVMVTVEGNTSKGLPFNRDAGNPRLRVIGTSLPAKNATQRVA